MCEKGKYVCVCVCVRERERERGGGRERGGMVVTCSLALD